MQQRHGFTLPEILITISIISVFAAILLPMLINPRARAYDVATQACLREVSARQLAKASQDPFKYDPNFMPSTVAACNEVGFTFNTSVTPEAFTYEAKHNSGAHTFAVSAGTGVVKVN
ncbi:hypothetical protein BH24DEI2_BH24DEI2_02640 [soil metagenome]